MESMADSASESDSSSIDGCALLMPPSPATREQLQKRIDSLQQQNRVLKVEMETYKLRVVTLLEENKNLRQASVNIQARAEQEEEYISNTLLKKIQVLKKEKETLAHHYEQEEECLTNDLSRKLSQLRKEKCALEQTLEQEQECLVNRLMRKIRKLETETNAKQANLDQLRREKIELENTLEQEQEALVNRLWKRMDKLEAEKRSLQIKLDQPVSCPPSPHDISTNGEDQAVHISSHIQVLRSEVTRLRNQLDVTEKDHTKKVEKYAKEERIIREENVRLQKKLQVEMEKKSSLCRHLSESESSLEFDDGQSMDYSRPYNASSPHYPLHSPCSSRPISPGIALGIPRDVMRCPPMCSQPVSYTPCQSPHTSSTSASFLNVHQGKFVPVHKSERFAKPSQPWMPSGGSPIAAPLSPNPAPEVEQQSSDSGIEMSSDEKSRH